MCAPCAELGKEPKLGLIHTCDFFRRELFRELFSQCHRKKWVHNPLLNFSVHAIVDQIAGVNVLI